MALSNQRSLVIFDLDGTLADTLADLSTAMNRALKEFGLATHAPAFFAQYVGEGVDRLVEQILGPGELTLKPQLTAAFRAYYAANLIVESAPYPGVPALLECLKRRGVEIAVLSNKPDQLTQRLVNALFPCDSFLAICGHLPEIPKKPDPTMALRIADEAGCPPGACALVGDTPVDIRTAAAAGMMPIGVQWGFRRREDLVGAHAVVDRPMEILSLLTGF